MQVNIALNESIRKSKVFGWLSLMPWILATLFTAPFCFLSLKLLIPLFLLTLIIACFSIARFSHRPVALRAVTFITSLMGALSLVEIAASCLNGGGSWRSFLGVAAGIFFALPMFA
ncbi:hypothetical protein, partial [Acidiferrobacter sp.]|uniref:hypothetical protein n=1 Tax=Acidiferrobacter sp. TaxID=1872107 RepID=UPI00262AB618